MTSVIIPRMSNFSAFNKDHIRLLLEPFAPGMAEHITPIKYEAITPDCFLLLFRTTAHNGDEHFFVSLETDSVKDLVGAECTITDWHGSFIRFFPLHAADTKGESENIDDYKAVTGGPYFGMLAEVKRPSHKGYWAEAIKIMPGDKIGEKIGQYSAEEQVKIRKVLANILQHTVDPEASFAESLQAKHQNTVVDDVNNTNIVVSLYVQPNGEVEYFYNRVS